MEMEQASSCQGARMGGRGVDITIKGYHKEDLCGYGRILHPDYNGGYTNLQWQNA